MRVLSEEKRVVSEENRGQGSAENNFHCRKDQLKTFFTCGKVSPNEQYTVHIGYTKLNKIRTENELHAI